MMCPIYQAFVVKGYKNLYHIHYFTQLFVDFYRFFCEKNEYFGVTDVSNCIYEDYLCPSASVDGEQLPCPNRNGDLRG